MTSTNGTAKSHAVTSLEGVVEAVNERGLKIGGEWANCSKFRPITLPPLGARVRLSVDAKGFIQSIEKITHDASFSDRSENCSHGESNRLAVLQAAAAFGASRPDLKSSDVLRIADSWLAWIES